MTDIKRTLEIMAALRDPESGCPWDIEQTFDTIRPHTIEEAYEVADAIERGDMHDLQDELGDLLFQVVYYAQMASEQGDFCFDDVVAGLNEKLVRRQPHVFGEEEVESAEHLAERWEQHKQAERDSKPANSSALDGVAASLPALLWSQKLQKRAARTGFDWPDIQPVFAKLAEELDELKEELKHPGNQQRIHDEYGDVLFVCVNLGMHMQQNAEESLRYANRKFIDRFGLMETLMQQDGKTFDELSLEQMEAYWVRAKEQLRAKGSATE